LHVAGWGRPSNIKGNASMAESNIRLATKIVAPNWPLDDASCSGDQIISSLLPGTTDDADSAARPGNPTDPNPPAQSAENDVAGGIGDGAGCVDDAPHGERPAEGEGGLQQIVSAEILPSGDETQTALEPQPPRKKKRDPRDEIRTQQETEAFLKAGWDDCKQKARALETSTANTQTKRHALMGTVAIFVADARWSPTAFNEFCRSHGRSCTKATQANRHAAVFRAIEPNGDPKVASDRGIAVKYALQMGCSPDGVAAFLDANGGVRNCVRESREAKKVQKRALAGATLAEATQSSSVPAAPHAICMEISGVPPGLSGRVAVTIEVTGGRGRYIGHAPADVTWETPASPGAPAIGGTDGARPEIAPGGTDEGDAPDGHTGAPDNRPDGEDAAGGQPPEEAPAVF
jgi:hypothetical protein